MVEFAVIRFAEGWRILFDGHRRGRFDQQVDAVNAALRLAGDVRRTGRSSRILVQDPFGEVVSMPEGQPIADRGALAERAQARR